MEDMGKGLSWKGPRRVLLGYKRREKQQLWASWPSSEEVRLKASGYVSSDLS